ncbi:MAG: 30S ribosomal protein S18 [bacterium]
MINSIKQQKKCHFCVSNINNIDYKDVETLCKFTNSYGQILSRKRTGVCAKHQRKLATSIKRARIMALVIFTNR